MGYSTRVGLGVGLLIWPQLVKAEPAPPTTPQWTTPTPSAAAPASPRASSSTVPPVPAAAAPAAPTAAPTAPAAPTPQTTAPATPAAEPTLPPPPPPPPSGPGAGARPPVYGPYPGYAPPPPGYEYGYYYPPLPPAPKLRYPSNAAVSSTPFFDALVVGVNWENRFSEFLNIGAQAGVFVQERLRLSARIAFATDTVRDDYSGREGFSAGSKSYAFIWGGSVGVAAVSTSNFAMSPGITFGRSDVSDYGSMLGLSLPFDWVLGSGVRIGLDLELGRAFGGRYAVDCQFSGACTSGFRDRPAGTAFSLQFHVGFGLNHPAPLPPPAAPPWPAPPPAPR